MVVRETVLFLTLVFITVLPTSREELGNQELECGISNYRHRQPRRFFRKSAGIPQGRIIGGAEAAPGDWPWQISIQLTHPQWGPIGHWCGGVLVDPQWVLTGAHCLINRVFNFPFPSLWTIVAGEHNLRRREGTEQRMRVSRIVIHNLFREYHHDVALLQLAHPLVLDKRVVPICLPITNAIRRLDLEGLRCIATGWGHVKQGTHNSPTLQKVEIPIVATNTCRSVYASKYRIPIDKYHVCAGHLKARKGTCIGDSGGPLQCPIGDGRWFLIGLTSFGSGCVKPGFPDVFTRITYYMDWILHNIKKYSRVPLQIRKRSVKEIEDNNIHVNKTP